MAQDFISVLDPDDYEEWADLVSALTASADCDVDCSSADSAEYRIELGPQVRRLLYHHSRDVLDVADDQWSHAEVVRLGALCELSDATDPSLSSSVEGVAFSDCPIPSDYRSPHELRAASPGSPREVVYGGYYKACTPDELQAQGRELARMGIRELWTAEFAELDDGRRIILRDDRRWDIWPVPLLGSPQQFATGRDLTRHVFLILEPDSADDWVDWVVARLERLGTRVNPASVRAAPFDVDFGPRVQRHLRQSQAEARMEG